MAASISVKAPGGSDMVFYLLVAVIGFAAVYWFTRKASEVAGQAGEVIKNVSQAPANALVTATRSYDKIDGVYQDRIMTLPWLRNTFSTPTSDPNGGAWVPLPESEIIVPTDPDVPTLTERYVPNVYPVETYKYETNPITRWWSTMFMTKEDEAAYYGAAP